MDVAFIARDTHLNFLLPRDIVTQQSNMLPTLDSNVFTYQVNSDNDAIAVFETFTIQGQKQREHQIFEWLNNTVTFIGKEKFERRKDLSGVKIRVGLAEDYPFVFFPPGWDFRNNTKAKGMVIDILRNFQKVTGLKVQYTPSEDGLWGAKVNGTWNGLVGMLVRRKIDLSATNLSISPQRSRGMPGDDHESLMS